MQIKDTWTWREGLIGVTIEDLYPGYAVQMKRIEIGPRLSITADRPCIHFTLQSHSWDSECAWEREDQL